MNALTMIFGLPGNEVLVSRLAEALDVAEGLLEIREFPDGETYVRGETRCHGLDVALAANLFRPDPQILPLLFSVRALRDLGARKVHLVTPYLPYMRQDRRFRAGEVVTSRLFADLLSGTVDGLVTIDPHLHRYAGLEEIYAIDTRVRHAAGHIAGYIKDRISRPLLVGPDTESEQWVGEVAELAGAPFIVLSKTRHGDRDVEVRAPPLDAWREHTPVLVDDIISTARTMVETMGHLRRAGYRSPVCIGVHAIFAGDAYRFLQDAGAADIVTCNTLPHPTNAIDVTDLLADGLRSLLESSAAR